jgi:oleate hydratase
MPHASNLLPHGHHNGHKVRDPSEANAYLVGGGIASLAAAAHLIQQQLISSTMLMFR